MYFRNLHFEEGNKCFELDKIQEIVHEQFFALQDDWNDVAIYGKLRHVAKKNMKHPWKAMPKLNNRP